MPSLFHGAFLLMCETPTFEHIICSVPCTIAPFWRPKAIEMGKKKAHARMFKKQNVRRARNYMKINLSLESFPRRHQMPLACGGDVSLTGYCVRSFYPFFHFSEIRPFSVLEFTCETKLDYHDVRTEPII